jgi:mono/diheme cytochrome c family protein
MASKHLVAGLIGVVMLTTSAADVQPAQFDTSAADLKVIMRQLGQDMDALNAALWVRDFGAVATAATAIAEHPHVSPQERARIQAALRADFAAFGAADRRVHDAALRTAAAAANEDSAKLLLELGRLQAGCVACHDAFQERIREARGIDDSAPGDSPETDRGARVFAAYCAVCHGTTGKGDGPAAAVLVPPPPDLTGPRPARLRGIPRRAIIENGSPGSAMAAWKGVLPAEDLEAVYGFVHQMHGQMRQGPRPGRGRHGRSSN